MKTLACTALVGLLAACGTSPSSVGRSDGGARDGGAPQIGAPCDRNAQTLWPTECPGGANAICESTDTCGGPSGFCSQKCDSAPCPAGSVCVALTAIGAAGTGVEVRKRCFLPCAPPATPEAGPLDGGQGDAGAAAASCPGLLSCVPGYDVCAGGQFLMDYGSIGARAASGAACVAGTPPDPAAPPRLFSANFEVASMNGPNEAASAIGPDGAFYVAYNPGALSVSRDQGKSWTVAPLDDPTNIGDPMLAVDASRNRLYFSHLSSDGAANCSASMSGLGVNVSWSDDDGQTWAGTTRVTPPADFTGTLGVDKPWVVVSPKTGTVLVSYMVGSNLITATGSSEMVARSVDHGATFTQTELDAARPAFRNLGQLAVDDTGVVYAIWWETGQGAESLFGDVRLAKSYDDGATFAPSVEVTAGPIAIFDDPGVAVARDGSLVVATWAQAPAGAGPDEEDVWASASLTEGTTFLPPIKVNQDASCATHWHQWPLVTPSGAVYVVWYDNRWGDGRVVWAKGSVGGTPPALSFAPADLGFVTDATQPFTTSRYQFFTGDYLDVALSGTTGLAVWGDLRNAPTDGSDVFGATATLP